MLEVKAPVLAEPLTAFVPDQAPEAVQLVALVELQVSVEALPLATLVGFAVSVTVGAGGFEVTVTVAVWLAVPPAPVQVNVKSVVLLKAPVGCEPPLVASVPLQPPEAVQLVALVELQARFDEPPEFTVVGFAVSDTVGAAC